MISATRRPDTGAGFVTTGSTALVDTGTFGETAANSGCGAPESIAATLA